MQILLQPEATSSNHRPKLKLGWKIKAERKGWAALWRVLALSINEVVAMATTTPRHQTECRQGRELLSTPRYSRSLPWT